MRTSVTVSPHDLPLASLYHWERERAHQVYLSQPMGDGSVQDITWAQAADQVRRVAAWGSPTPGLGFGLANRLLAIYTVARLRKEVL